MPHFLRKPSLYRSIKLRFLRYLLPAILLVGMLGLSSCNLLARIPSTPTAAPNYASTAAAQTVAAVLTLAGTKQPAPVTQTPLPPALTGEVATPTKPPPTTIPPSSTPQPTPTSELPCDSARFVEDVTIPDDTKLLASEPFTKTWRLENTGTCTWNSAYSLVFEKGDAMDGPASKSLTTGVVPPNQELDVSVNLIAPDTTGSYRGDWKLRNPSGVIFGVGSNGDRAFWVEIEVIEPSPTPSVVFDAEYVNDSEHTCSGTMHAIFSIENTGKLPIESAEITIEDTTDNQTLSGPTASDAPFMGAPSECPPGGERIRVGSTLYLGASLGDDPESDNVAQASLKLCTEDDLEGVCSTETIEFSIP